MGAERGRLRPTRPPLLRRASICARRWRRSGPPGSEQRELVRLVFVEDRAVADVADRLGIPEGTVKSRVFKVRRLLRAALQQGGG